MTLSCADTQAVLPFENIVNDIDVFLGEHPMHVKQRWGISPDGRHDFEVFLKVGRDGSVDQDGRIQVKQTLIGVFERQNRLTRGQHQKPSDGGKRRASCLHPWEATHWVAFRQEVIGRTSFYETQYQERYVVDHELERYHVHERCQGSSGLGSNMVELLTIQL